MIFIKLVWLFYYYHYVWIEWEEVYMSLGSKMRCSTQSISSSTGDTTCESVCRYQTYNLLLLLAHKFLPPLVKLCVPLCAFWSQGSHYTTSTVHNSKYY